MNNFYLNRAKRERQKWEGISVSHFEFDEEVIVSNQHTNSLIDFLFAISKYVNFSDVSSILDAGAWVGLQSKELSRIFPSSHIFSFEPDPISFVRAEKTISNCENVTLFNLAISDESGIKDFYSTKGHYGGTSSLMRPLDIPFTPNKDVEKFEVEVTSLSAMIEQGKIYIPQIMKIDVQGSEYDLLAGMGKYLDEVLAIHIETCVDPYYEGQQEEARVLSLLNSFENLQTVETWEKERELYLVNKKLL